MAHRVLPSFFGRVTMALDEHRDLLKTSQRLRQACASLGSQSLSVDPEIPELVYELCSLLPIHFDAEEADGYFGTLIADCPRLESRVRRLVVEHDDMRKGLGEIREIVESSGPPAELVLRVNGLLDLLHAHERAERVLLQEFFTTDEGSAGAE